MAHDKKKPDATEGIWDSIKKLMTLAPSQKVLDEASKASDKARAAGYKAPTKKQSTSYLKKQIDRQQKLKKESKDPALDALSGKY